MRRTVRIAPIARRRASPEHVTDAASDGAVLVLDDDGGATLLVDEGIYCARAVLRAAYWLTDRAYVIVQRRRPGTLAVHVRPKQERATLAAPDPPSASALAGELANALLDHQLREEIAERTASVREILLEKAMLESGALEDPAGEVRDPLGIADDEESP